MTARESAIVNRILRNAKRIHGLTIRKRHGSASSTAGDPDLYGCYQGRHFEFEAKRPGERPTALQLARLEEWRAAGALTGWGTSWEDFCVILQIDP